MKFCFVFLSFQAIYSSGGNIYTQQSISWPTLSNSNYLQSNCGCPSPSKDLKKSNLFLDKSTDNGSFSNLIKSADECFVPNVSDVIVDENLHRKNRSGLVSPDRQNADDKSDDRYTASSPFLEKLYNTNCPATVSNMYTNSEINSFSVQRLTSKCNSSSRSHII